MEVEESEMTKELKEKARVSVEHFLQVGKRNKQNLPGLTLKTQKHIFCKFFEFFFLFVLFQELISDNVIGHTQPVFQFLCPLDKLLNEDEHYRGVWGLLSGLAYFLTPGQEEEEVKFIRLYNSHHIFIYF